MEDNAQYYVDWMHDNQKYIASWQSILPAVLVTVLTAGLLLWHGGSLGAGDFLTVAVLSPGLTGR